MDVLVSSMFLTWMIKPIQTTGFDVILFLFCSCINFATTVAFQILLSNLESYQMTNPFPIFSFLMCLSCNCVVAEFLRREESDWWLITFHMIF